MKRITAVLAAAALTAGCAPTSDDYDEYLLGLSDDSADELFAVADHLADGDLHEATRAARRWESLLADAETPPADYRFRASVVTMFDTCEVAAVSTVAALETFDIEMMDFATVMLDACSVSILDLNDDMVGDAG